VSLLIIRKQSIQLTALSIPAHILAAQRARTCANQISGSVHSMLHPQIISQYFLMHFQHNTPRQSRKELYHSMTRLPNLMKIIIIWSNFIIECINKQMWEGPVTCFIPSNLQMDPSAFWIPAHVNVVCVSHSCYNTHSLMTAIQPPHVTTWH
jgi:hypothetical protein